jgi:hypothetical protein
LPAYDDFFENVIQRFGDLPAGQTVLEM